MGTGTKRRIAPNFQIISVELAKRKITIPENISTLLSKTKHEINELEDISLFLHELEENDKINLGNKIEDAWERITFIIQEHYSKQRRLVDA